MQSPMSSSPAPLTAPIPPAHEPESPRPLRKGRRKIWWFLGVLVVIAAIAVGALWQKQVAVRRKAVGAGGVAVRTYTVRNGIVEKTLRLTGTTAAEHYVSLIAPQLRGSRSGYGRDYSSRRSGGSSTATVSADTSGSSSSSSSSSSASLSSPSGPSVSASSASDTGGGATSVTSSGVSRATNRSTSSRVSSGGQSGGSSGASLAVTQAASTGVDLGSTASLLPGGGGGGGGSGDFSLILQKLAPAGSFVRKGDVVAEFDRQFMLLRLDDYRDAVRQQQLDMINLRSSLEVSRTKRRQDLEAAKGQIEKAQLDLKTTPVRSEIDAEYLRLALDQAEAQYKALMEQAKYADISEVAAIRKEELDNQKAELELKRAEANVDKMVARAAIDGLVVMQNIVRGTDYGQIQAGDQLAPGQFYMQIVDPRSMVVNATVNQVDAELLRIGQKARVRFDAYPDLELPAHVYSIGAMTKAGGMRATFFKEIPVKLRLDRLDPRVIPDLSVAVNVILDAEKAETAVAPLAGIFRDAPDAQPYVFVKTGESWERREVELGVVSYIEAAVRSGLRPGEVIALDRPEPQKPGQG